MKRLTLLIILACVTLTSHSQEISGKSNSVYLKVGEEKVDPSLSIHWISPSASASVLTDKELEIKVGIKTTSPVSDVKVYLNDDPVVQRGFKIVDASESSYDHLIERKLILLEGTNTIKVIAQNEEGIMQTDSRQFNVELPVIVSTRTDYAILFATDDYDSWGDLVNPVNDAKTIAKELEDYYGFKVELALNNTIDDILIKLREYATKSYLEDDQLFIFFAGHGQFDDVYKTGYIVGSNSKKVDPAKTSYLSHSVLRDVVDNIPSKHIFLTMDVCFGGTFDRTIARAGSRGEDGMYQEITQAEFIKRKLRFKTRRYLTSGGKEYVPDGRPGRHSPFARKFLEALRSYGGSDRILTLSEITNYVGRINPEPRFDEFGDNEPGSDFVFVAR